MKTEFKNHMEDYGILYKIAFIFVVLGTFLLGKHFSYSDTMERRLSNFSLEKEKLAKTQEGIISYQGDTIKFSLLPPVEFAINPQDKDKILIISGNKRCLFTRRMINDYGIPAPVDGKKAMTNWVTNSDKKTAKIFIKKFNEIVKNGKVDYNIFVHI